MPKWADRLARGIADREAGKPDVVQLKAAREKRAVKVTKDEKEKSGSMLTSAMKPPASREDLLQ